VQVVDPEICGDAGAPPCLPPGLLDDLIGFWRLDDGAPNAIARDASGRGNHAALVGLDGATAWVPGRANTGVQIGAKGWLAVSSSPSLEAIREQVTVTAWIYREGAINLYATAASRQIGASIEQHYHLSLDATGRPSLFLGTDQVLSLHLGGPSVIATATWTHLAGTYDGTTARLYVDGILTASAPLTGAIAGDTTPFVIGGNGNDATGVPTELFPGRIDEVMLYRRALGDAEVALLRAGIL
jgi:hypothetical protein